MDMDLEFILTIISIVLVVISIVISLWINWKRIRLANYTISLPILKDMIKEFRSPEFKKHRDYIKNNLRNQHDPDKCYSDLHPSAKIPVTTVSRFLDHLGILVVNKYIDDKYIMSFIGENIDNLWQILEPYIQNEREKRKNPYYQGYFQKLVYRVRKTDLRKLREKKYMNLNKCTIYN